MMPSKIAWASSGFSRLIHVSLQVDRIAMHPLQPGVLVEQLACKFHTEFAKANVSCSPVKLLVSLVEKLLG